MYACCIRRQMARCCFVLLVLAVSTAAAAQAPAEAGQHEGHVMAPGDLQIPMTRDGSGHRGCLTRVPCMPSMPKQRGGCSWDMEMYSCSTCTISAIAVRSRAAALTG